MAVPRSRKSTVMDNLSGCFPETQGCLEEARIELKQGVLSRRSVGSQAIF